MKRLTQHILLVATLACLLFCSGCTPRPATIQNDTRDVIGVILLKREPPSFKVTFQKHRYINAGKSVKLWDAYQANYIKLYSKSGLVGIWPVRSRDQFTVKASGGKNKIEVTRESYSRYSRSFSPLNTYEWTRTTDLLGVYSIWILFHYCPVKKNRTSKIWLKSWVIERK